MDAQLLFLPLVDDSLLPPSAEKEADDLWVYMSALAELDSDLAAVWNTDEQTGRVVMHWDVGLHVQNS
ncbi:MAG: hypothetical protein KDE51_21075 [Anaerolineales bacterium]|nr:hypothetical protein [Anaerolineales bacterium]